jgi:hypothetical protein
MRSRANDDIVVDAEPCAIEEACTAYLARERRDDRDTHAEREIFSGGIDETAILGIAKMLDEKRAVPIVRIAGQRTDRRRAVGAVERVLVEQAEGLAGRLHERREKLPGERRLAGAGMTAEKNQMLHA